MWHNIPAELRSRKQWVAAGDNKVPINPRTGQPASVADKATWGSYEEAVHSGYKHIGFVLTQEDPFSIIDLDNKPDRPCTPEQWARHQQILNTFESYTERSASGRGYHIIVKGVIPAGVHRDNVEIYSDSRYMICTGNVVRNAPIAEYQSLLEAMYGEMNPIDPAELEDIEGTRTDEEILEMGNNAENGNKFLDLCNGMWEEMGYPSQSEADYALLAMLAFYTPDNEQVRRIFRYTKLGKREKATKNDAYLNRCLSKIRAVQAVPDVDIDGIIKASENLLAGDNKDPTPPDPQTLPEKPYGETPALLEITDTLPVPPGLVGEIARYVFESAVRPVPEVGLAAGLGLMAGVAGRAYNINGIGLNLYLILLAKTGSGKEGLTSGIDRIIAATRPSVPMVDDFIGPAAFASGQGLVKYLDEHPNFVSVLGEFGLTLQQICDPRASSAEMMLRKVLLDLYMKSGWNSTLRSTTYSDKDKSTKNIQAPAVTILGESTQDRFFDGLDASHITEGLIPRFCCLEYTGFRPRKNEFAGAPPSTEMIGKFTEVVVQSLAAQQNNACIPVSIDPGALTMLDRFDTECDGKINHSDSTVDSELWNRGHLKALRISALLAIGCNCRTPIVTAEHAQWAIEFVKRDIAVVATRFRKGDVGSGDSKMIVDLKRVMKDYITSSPGVLEAYGVEKVLIKDKVIPYSYLQRRTANLSAFRRDRRGSSQALKAALGELIDSGYIVVLPKSVVQVKYKMSSILYGIVKSWND
jgi:hypothetical protein